MKRTNLLEDLLERMVRRRGLDYLAASKATKRYIEEVSESWFRSDAENITDPGQIGQLLSVGLHRWQLDLLAEARAKREAEGG